MDANKSLSTEEIANKYHKDNETVAQLIELDPDLVGTVERCIIGSRDKSYTKLAIRVPDQKALSYIENKLRVIGLSWPVDQDPAYPDKTGNLVKCLRGCEYAAA